MQEKLLQTGAIQFKVVSQRVAILNIKMTLIEVSEKRMRELKMNTALKNMAKTTSLNSDYLHFYLTTVMILPHKFEIKI